MCNCRAGPTPSSVRRASGFVELVEELPAEASTVRSAGFASLRRGQAATVAEVARSTGLDTHMVEQVLAAMAGRGAGELDAQGRVVGIGGLSLVPTRHGLMLDGVPLHTWCAVDALGIPAALGVDAVARMRCARCGRSVEVAFRAGIPEDATAAAVWFPRAQARNVRRDFCDLANLFCGRDHLDAWHTAAGRPPGEALTVAEAAERGRANWAQDARWGAPALDVVFLHGWLMGPDLWDAQVAGLDGSATAHALAAPAHGAPAPPEGFDMAAWAAHVIDGLDRRGVRRAVFVGHSMGGWLAQQIWRDHPQRVLGTGLVGTTERPGTVGDRRQFVDLAAAAARDWRPVAPTIASLLVGTGFLASHPGWLARWTDHVARHYDLAGMATLVAAINGRPDYAPTTDRIDVPTVVIHGTDDRAIPLDLGRQLAARTPHAELVEVGGAGHAVPIERPAPVTAAVRALVERVAVAATP